MTAFIVTDQYAVELVGGRFADKTVSEHRTWLDAVEAARQYVTANHDSNVVISLGTPEQWENLRSYVSYDSDTGRVRTETA